MEQCILPYRSYSEDHIVAFVQFPEHFRDVGGIILAIAVECHDDGTDSRINAGFHGDSLSVVASQFQNTTAGIFGSALFQQ